MRLCTLIALAAAGCASSIAEPDGPDAGSRADAGQKMDASTSSVCEAIVENPSGSIDRGRVGSDAGGGKGPLLKCDDQGYEQIVGLSLQMSNQATVFGGRSAQGIAIGCARVTIDPSGAAQLGEVKPKMASGTGTNGWAPSTWTPMTECKPGWVVSGLLVHRGTSGNRFLDVTMTCSHLGPTGKTLASESIKLAGSLTDTASPDQVKCAAGEVISKLPTFTGAGLDAVEVYCSTTACI